MSPARLTIGVLQCALLVAPVVVHRSGAGGAEGSGRPSARSLEVAPGRLLGLELYRPEPDHNPTTPERVELGRRLFQERRLSRDGSLACVDCHRPDRAFTDGRARSIGVLGRLGARSVPSLVNRAWGKAFFWDGRVVTLEEQVLHPIVARLEMDLPVERAVERLRGTRRYADRFREVFGREVNAGDLGRALAAYVRTIQAGASPYDRYVWGERNALSPEARVGLGLFRGKANCAVCHAGPNLTDEGFHNTGVSWGRHPYDSGRGMVTGRPEDTGRFKTPTLREIGHTAPYMHDGSLPTLEDVIEFYDRGGNANPYRDRDLRPLSLAASEKHALLSFLGSLSGQIRDGVNSPLATGPAVGFSIRYDEKTLENLRSGE